MGTDIEFVKVHDPGFGQRGVWVGVEVGIHEIGDTWLVEMGLDEGRVRHGPDECVGGAEEHAQFGWQQIGCVDVDVYGV